MGGHSRRVLPVEMLMRTLVALTAVLAILSTPVLADDKDDALAACAKYLKRANGVSSLAGFQVSGSGDRYEVSGNAPYQGHKSRVVCKVHNGRVTNVTWG